MIWWLTCPHIREAGKEESKEEVEDDQVGDEDSGHEVGQADGAVQEHAVPHGFYPFSTQHTKHDHKTKIKFFEELKHFEI